MKGKKGKCRNTLKGTEERGRKMKIKRKGGRIRGKEGREWKN
jgi:hypothetical protein